MGRILITSKALEKYEKLVGSWDSRASIRKKPRRMIDLVDPNAIYDQDFFPRSRQPLAFHPEVVASLSEVQIKQLLIQTCYKFMNDIALIETEAINKVALSIANQRYGQYEFPIAIRKAVYTVIIDEDYHAFVALDALDQIVTCTAIPQVYDGPFGFQLINAVAKTKAETKEAFHDAIDIIAICMGENSLTKDLVSITNVKGLERNVLQIMADHMLDEGRHSLFFAALLTDFWFSQPADARRELSMIVPKLIYNYLTEDSEHEFNLKVLGSLGFSEDRAKSIVQEIKIDKKSTDLMKVDPVARQLLSVFLDNSLLECDHLRTEFKKLGWIQ